MALSALPAWRSPTTALNREMTISTMAVVHSLINSDTMAAPTRMICM